MMSSVANISKKLPQWSREFDTLVRAIGECKSKAEEDAIIYREVETLKPRLKDAKMDKRWLKEVLIRLMYVEMLGHDASWGHVKALQACSEQNLLTKKVAYLASSLFLEHNSDLIVLVVNTMLQDLRSENYLTVCAALTAACKLIGVDLINALFPAVVGLLTHPKELVRKKAIMLLHRFLQLDPSQMGPLSDIDLAKHFRTALCDKDPSVMGASLCVLQEAASKNPRAYKNLIPSFVSILKQVYDHKLPKQFDYHHVSAPFIQIKLLKLLAIMGTGDKGASENMYAVVGEAMRKADGKHTIGNAIIYECIRTITSIWPNPTLLQAAAEMIATFLRSSSHNLKYIGIDALGRIVRINASYAHEHQLAVIDCLEDPDDTLRSKTLDLLTKMTNPTNVEVIIEKMVDYLRGAADDVQKADAVRKISDLAERFAPDTQWFIDIMNQVFELGGDVVEASLANNLMRLIAEGAGQDDEAGDAEMRAQAVSSYLALLDKPNLPDILLQVICWVLGEYGTVSGSSAGEVMDRLSAVPEAQHVSDTVRGYMLSAFGKLSAASGVHLPASAQEIQAAALSSSNPDLQQRALELDAILSLPRSTQQKILPPDASCEDIDVDPSLGFMSGFVQQALQAGAAPYISEEDRFAMGAVRPSHQETAVDSSSQGLRFTAYERQAAPEPVTVNTVSRDSSPIREMGEFQAGFQSGFIGSSELSRAPTNEPQLVVPAAGKQRWGPATFTPQVHAPAASTPAPVPSSSANTGGRLNTSSKADYYPDSVIAAPEMGSEKSKLAGLLFGGGNSSKASRSKAAPPRKAAGSKARPEPEGKAAPPQAANFIDFGEDVTGNEPQANSVPKTSPATGDPFAMLEGLQHPSAISSPPKAQSDVQQSSQAIDLDALYGLQPNNDTSKPKPAASRPQSADPFGLGSLTGTSEAGTAFNGSVQGLSNNAAGFGMPTQQQGAFGLDNNDPFGFGAPQGTQATNLTAQAAQSQGGKSSGGSAPMMARGNAAVEQQKPKKDPFADLFA